MPNASAPLPPATAWPRRLRVGLVEDDAASRESFAAAVRAQPDLTLALVAATRQEALQLLPHHQLDVLLVDLGLPDGSGLDVIRAARRCWPRCGVMVSTIFGDESHVLRSIEAGAMGYLLKDSDSSQLADEIRSLAAGGSPISPMVARKILARAASAMPPPAPDEPLAGLSVRELQVLRHISKGFTTEEAARAMGVSRTTVLTFVRRVYAKLEVSSRAEAVDAAHRQGLLGN